MKRDLTLAALSTPMRLSGEWRVALAALALALAWIVGWYATTATAIVDTWARSETYAHGFVVVPIVIWLVYRMRDRLLQHTPRPWWPPLVPMFVVGFAWLLGVLGTVNALTQAAFVAMLALAVPAILGPSIGRALMFPLGFLFFAVPLGDFLLPLLMEWTANFTILALRLSGVPVYREGLQFVIPNGHWSIIEACSGVRYLIASLLTGTLFAYVTYRSNWRRVAFAGVAIAVPIIANWLRAYMIVMIGYLSNNELATGIDHILYGWLFFGIVMLLLFGVGMRWREAPAAADAQPLVALRSVPAPPAPPASPWPVLAALLVVTAAWPLIVSATRSDDRASPVTLRAIDVPGWNKASAAAGSGFVPQFKTPSAVLSESLTRNGETVGLYIAYYRGQDFKRKLVTSENVLVPSNDVVWIELGKGGRDADIAGSSRRIRTATLQGPGERRLRAWHWYWIGGEITSSDAIAKARIAWQRLTGHGDDAAVIIVDAPILEGANADATLQAFSRDAWPAIDAALRRAQGQR